jgi:hypothetical protein
MEKSSGDLCLLTTSIGGEQGSLIIMSLTHKMKLKPQGIAIWSQQSMLC